MLPRTVVVPLDGSSLAERALEPALALARGFGAPVRLVRATLERPADDAAAYLRQVAERFDLDPDDISVPIGFAANGIVDQLETASEPLLCLSTRGRTGAGELVLGSVAIAVLRRTVQPVLLVGPATGCSTVAEREAPIVFCFDGSPAARRVEPLVTEWAGRLQLPVRVTTALHRSREFLGTMPADEVLHAGREVTDRLVGLGITADHVIVDGIDPARAIAEDAGNHRAALVVAGSSRGDPSSASARLVRSVLGSTAERLVRRSSAPVLIVSG